MQEGARPSGTTRGQYTEPPALQGERGSGQGGLAEGREKEAGRRGRQPGAGAEKP